MTGLVLYFSVAVFISFLCSLLESVLLSVSPAYIALSLQRKKSYGRKLSELKDNIDRPLTAILTLNTFANMVGAAGVGMETLKLFGSYGFALALVSGILTLSVLIFSEILPKTIGTMHWKTLAPFTSYVVWYLIPVAYPFVVLSKSIKKLFSLRAEKKVTREEMIVTAEMGANEGSIRQKEGRVIKNLLMLDVVKVSDIMTPRPVIVAYDVSETVESVLNKNKILRFSRIPLFTEDLDNVEGVLHRYKLLDAASQDLDHLSVRKLMKPVHFIPENISVSAVLDQFIKRKEHLFIVVDEYGSTTGLVTLEDAIETLLGVEIMDEFDSVEDMREYAVEKWRERKKTKRTIESSNGRN